MKSMFKSILALAMLTLFANINWAMGQTVNMNRWIELESDSVERVITFKFAADSPNTKARLLCGTLDTTFSIGTYLYYFSFYVPSHTVTIYGDITKFDCSSRYLTELDISNNTGLTTLYCHSNSFISLDFSGQTALEELDCSHFFESEWLYSFKNDRIRF
ncbi:MAG TPA: hypothetical protein GX007_02580 [Bacteroidales bacterium]|jgi:hypothetical protein|nr:hypothetical protein [Bacteroidales bacterium]